MIGGLPDGRFALFCKIHHFMVDGLLRAEISHHLLGGNFGQLS
ncbi:MAG: wax ester/triacylglycerol synthase family O-acyltransferase [Actinomycetia bacterium]|nr:wax ester/triacylglycerol synthase family O-acyltransferase [Actinomycetes bacterium]